VSTATLLRERARPAAVPLPPPPGPDRGTRIGEGLARAAPWLLLGAYVLQLALIVPRHEAWFDEAQAWLLARDSGLWELFAERLRYEGNPGLWHVILFALVRAGVPYEGLGWVSGAIAVSGAALLVHRGPFPLWVKAGLLFSFALGYQEAVVARSYVLLPPLLFALAASWPSRSRRVGRIAVLLALLAGVSLHGLLIAGSFAALRAWELGRSWRRLDARRRRHHLVAAAALALQAAATAVVLWPPADLSPLSAGWDLRGESILWLLDRSLTGTGWLTAAALAATVPWFRRTRTLALWAVPTVVLLLFLALKYHAPHHEELPFLVWVTVLWISFGRDRGGDDRRLRRVALAGIACVLAVQVVWWGRTYAYDWTESYSGGRELARYLATLPAATEVWTADWPALAALPYFDDNVFDNLNSGVDPSYWVWRADKTGQLDLAVIDAYLNQPDVWVWPVKFDSEREYPDLPGYRRVLLVEGGVYSKDRVVDDEAFVVYERVVP